MGLLFMKPINGTSVMLRRSVLDEFGTFDSTLGDVDGDGDLWMRYSAISARFATIPGAPVFYRDHEGQTSKRLDEMTEGCIRTRLRMIAALRETGTLERVLQEAWPVLLLAMRGAYRQWPLVASNLFVTRRETCARVFQRAGSSHDLSKNSEGRGSGRRLGALRSWV